MTTTHPAAVLVFLHCYACRRALVRDVSDATVECRSTRCRLRGVAFVEAGYWDTVRAHVGVTCAGQDVTVRGSCVRCGEGPRLDDSRLCFSCYDEIYGSEEDEDE